MLAYQLQVVVDIAVARREIAGPLVIEQGCADVTRLGLGVGEIESELGGVAPRVDELLEKLGRLFVAAISEGTVGGIEIGIGAVRVEERRKKVEGGTDKEEEMEKKPQVVERAIHSQAGCGWSSSVRTRFSHWPKLRFGLALPE